MSTAIAKLSKIHLSEMCPECIDRHYGDFKLTTLRRNCTKARVMVSHGSTTVQVMVPHGDTTVQVMVPNDDST